MSRSKRRCKSCDAKLSKRQRTSRIKECKICMVPIKRPPTLSIAASNARDTPSPTVVQQTESTQSNLLAKLCPPSPIQNPEETQTHRQTSSQCRASLLSRCKLGEAIGRTTQTTQTIRASSIHIMLQWRRLRVARFHIIWIQSPQLLYRHSKITIVDRALTIRTLKLPDHLLSILQPSDKAQMVKTSRVALKVAESTIQNWLSTTDY